MPRGVAVSFARVFDELVPLRLHEEGSVDAYPRAALDLRDPPVPVLVELHWLMSDMRPRWAQERPIWVRAGGIDLQPTPGLLRGWVMACNGLRYGIVDLQLRSRNSRLQLSLPGQLVAERALTRRT